MIQNNKQDTEPRKVSQNITYQLHFSLIPPKTVQKKGMFNNTLRQIHLIKPQTYYINIKSPLIKISLNLQHFPLLKFVLPMSKHRFLDQQSRTKNLYK